MFRVAPGAVLGQQGALVRRHLLKLTVLLLENIVVKRREAFVSDITETKLALIPALELTLHLSKLHANVLDN